MAKFDPERGQWIDEFTGFPTAPPSQNVEPATWDQRQNAITDMGAWGHLLAPTLASPEQMAEAQRLATQYGHPEVLQGWGGATNNDAKQMQAAFLDPSFQALVNKSEADRTPAEQFFVQTPQGAMNYGEYKMRQWDEPASYRPAYSLDEFAASKYAPGVDPRLGDVFRDLESPEKQDQRAPHRSQFITEAIKAGPGLAALLAMTAGGAGWLQAAQGLGSGAATVGAEAAAADALAKAAAADMAYVEGVAPFAAETFGTGALPVGATTGLEAVADPAWWAQPATEMLDPIEIIDSMVRVTGAETGTQAANILGYNSVEAALAAIDPNLLTSRVLEQITNKELPAGNPNHYWDNPIPWGEELPPVPPGAPPGGSSEGKGILDKLKTAGSTIWDKLTEDPLKTALTLGSAYLGYQSGKEQQEAYEKQLEQLNRQAAAAEARRAYNDAAPTWITPGPNRSPIFPSTVDPTGREFVHYPGEKRFKYEDFIRPQPVFAATGGALSDLMAMQGADSMEAPYIDGPGGGQDDQVPGLLSEGEFVIPADVVAALGDGNNEAGAQQLYDLIESVRTQQGRPNELPPKAKAPLQYLKG